ncbi:energy transducer TonB [Marilutibacter alkalisoli]|uniref:Energy transducer TonB n=1 Tax=Marilutibacter alkalisoli TaxID=2591633 RepID=A0A514BRV0_9GAMM|nr:energy transducer TonB [Lysobacter alkalisoli]QDH70111.1 energy transducer TonB [Lysobacter alkalisoli]
MKQQVTLVLISIAAVAVTGCRAPPPPADPDQPTTEVAAVRTPPPDYPLEQACDDIGGQVVMQVVIGPEGRATEILVANSSGVPALDEAAQAAVREWEFKPATHRGKPVSQTIQVPMSFTPPEEPSELCLERETRAPDQL